MGRDDWYRRESWSAEDEEAFRARNRRSRGDDSKAQYLQIQAATLYATQKSDLLEPALRLAEECLREYPNAKMSRARALDLAGCCCQRLRRFEDALSHFRSALNFEREFPGVQSLACFHFARLVVEQRVEEEYDAALDALSDFGAPVFPWHAFILNAVTALIAAERGDVEGSRSGAVAALAAAEVTDSGLRGGREKLGLVSPDERDSDLFRRVRELV